MDKKTELETARWVEERMARLAAPHDWEPDAVEARTRLQGHLPARRSAPARTWLTRTAVLLACLILLFAIPTTRALTQQLWQWLTVRKVEVVQADFQRLRGVWLVPQMRFEKVEVQEPMAPRELPEPVGLLEAARRAGFVPRLPHEGVPPVLPDLRALDPMVWSTTLKAADLESSLRQAGVDDEPVPPEWDGATLSIHLGSTIVATWRGEVSLLQHPAITLSAPAGFEIAAYWRAALRAAGVSHEQARQLAERMTTAPTMLLGIAAETRVAIRDVNLRSGRATLIEMVGDTGRVERVNLIWSVAGRVYHLDATSEGRAVKAANSIQ